jgi:hypothetical protein
MKQDLVCPFPSLRVYVRFEDFVTEETAPPCKCFVHLFKTDLHINKAVDAGRHF